MEQEISWQEREIRALKSVQRNAATSIVIKSSTANLSTTVNGRSATQRYITFTPNEPCDYVQLSVSGYYDQAMTRPLETQTAGVASLGYLTDSVPITSFQTSKSGNNFRLSLKFWKVSDGNITVYLKATSVGEQEGTFVVS